MEVFSKGKQTLQDSDFDILVTEYEGSDWGCLHVCKYRIMTSSLDEEMKYINALKKTVEEHFEAVEQERKRQRLHTLRAYLGNLSQDEKDELKRLVAEGKI